MDGLTPLAIVFTITFVAHLILNWCCIEARQNDLQEILDDIQATASVLTLSSPPRSEFPERIRNEVCG